MSRTVGKVIKCKAAICWSAKTPLTIEEVEVAPPKAHEVRIKIVSTAICHTDANVIDGLDPSMNYPVILGHEGAGIVESVGEGVTCVKPGDHVIPLYLSQCKECDYCTSGRTNLCSRFFGMSAKALLPDGTTRFTCKGKMVYAYMGISTFSEYTVVSDVSVCKINSKANLEKVCLLGCGISTGYGAAINTAKVRPGSTCAIWGMGVVGLAVALGCKASGASKIIGIDINPDKFKTAKLFGVTECINPKKQTRPIVDLLMEMTNGGVDYAFECVGDVRTMRQAMESCHLGWGKAIQIGVGSATLDASINPMQLVCGKTWTGTVFGGWKSKDEIPKLVEMYMSKELMVDEMVSHNMKLDEIEEAFRIMKSGVSLRIVLHF